MAMQTGGGTARDRIMARARALDDEEKKKQQAQQPQQTRQSARAQVPMRYRQTAQEPGQEAAQQPQTTARDRIQARARAMGQQRVMSGLGDLTVEEYQYALKQAEAASPKRDENPGFFSRVGKWLVGKTEKTPEEIVAEQWDALEAARKREELASLDLDEYEKLLEQAKKQAADARPDFNIHAMGAYDAAAENTQAKRKADEMQQTYNLAKQVQFERQGEQALAQLTPKQLEAVETLVQTPATGTSVMSAGVARENARDQAYSVLLEGGYSYKTISDLVTWRSRQQDKEAYQKTVQWHEDLADSGVLGGAAATVLSVPENLLSGVGAIDVALQKANQTGGEERPVNYYSAPMRLYGGANAARETVGQKLERNTNATIFGQNVASTAYGIGTSMLDSGATAALAAIGVPPVVGSSLLGGAAATGAMVDAKDRGVDDTHALWTGVFAGVAETLFEDVSLEKLLKLDVPQGTLRQRMQTTLKNTLLQAGTEGSEELFTDFANYITDRAINGGLSEYDTAVRAYMDQGLSQKEASQKAGADLAAQMALDFVAGGVAGGLMAGGKAAIDNAGQNREMRRYSDLAPAAAEERLAADPGSRAARRVQKQVQQGKPVSGAALRETMAQNVEAQNQAVTEQVRKLAQQRLEELGDTQAEKTSRAVAQLYDRELPWYRQELARKVLRSSEYGQRVANEMEDAVETGRIRTLLEQAGETEDAAKVPRWTSGEWAENLPRYTSQGAYINQLMERRVNPSATDKRPVTGFRYNQETGQLDAIVKGEDGKVETIPKERAATTGRQEWLADLAADLKEAAPTMIASYMEGQDVQTFSRQWHNAYEYGAAGVKKDYAMNSQAVDQLNVTQRELAYDAGAAARAVQQARERMKFSREGQGTGMAREGTVSLKGATVGGVTYAPVTQETMTRRQRDSVEVMRQLARVSGVDVVFYQSRANGQGRYTEANGFYRDGTVYLDINAGKNAVGDLSETAVLLTASHELTHFIQEYSPAQYEQLRDFVVERLTESQDTDLDTLVERHRRAQPGLSYDQALDEVVADGCQMMLKDSRAAAQLAKKNRSLAGNIRSWLRKWVKRLQEAMRGLTARSREARAMEQYAGELQKIWDNALVRAAENRQRAQSGQETGAAAQTRTEGQYEIRYPTYTDEQMEKNATGLRTMKAVAKVTGDELGPRSISIKERVTKYFASLGNNVHTEAFGDVALSNSSVHSEIRHGHTSAKVATYAAIPEVLRFGVVIYRKEKNRHGLERIVVAAPVEVGINAEKMYVGVMLQRDPQTQRLYLHDAVTEKESAAQTDGHLSTTGPNGMESELYTTSILHRALQVKKNTESKPAGALPKTDTHATPIDSASNDSIRSSAGNSQEKFSLRDSTGRELSEGQQEYFADSKVRDEKGNLLVVYHQTNGEFTVFDTKHKGAGTGDNETPFGVFLKRTARDIGIQGKKQMELYADIRSPLRVKTREELVHRLGEMSEEYAGLKAEAGRLDREYGKRFDEAKRAFIDFLTKWRKNNQEAPGRAAYNAEGFDAAFNAEDEVVKEWTKKQDALALKAKEAATAALRENGYDGVFLEKDQGSWGRSTEAYIALDPTQVKNIDNLTPTGDPDIRYQARGSADDGVVSIKQQLKDAQKLLEDMSVVTRKSVFEDVAKMSAKQRLDWAVNELKSSGYRVERPDGKVIEFGPKDINSGLRYLDSAGEVAAYTALPAVLKRGRVIYAEGNHKGRGYGTITIAAPVEINGVRGNMAVVVRQTKGHRYDVHRILMPDGSAFIFREKANAVSTTVGSVTGDAKAPGEVRPTINTASTDSIRSSAGNSQEKFSMRDSTGRELSEGQQEYFADSKVRDRDGRLKAMYRGGNGTFTVFDRKRSKPSNLYGRGFYFTDSKEHASQYGRAREFYLNITHPVPMQETTITRAQLRKFLEAVAENDEDFSFENYGYGATVDSVLKSVFGKSDFAMLYDVNQTAIGDMVAAVELFNEINGTDFDGLILDTETVAFRSEQIKSTDNLTPTGDPDIRYQARVGTDEESGRPIYQSNFPKGTPKAAKAERILKLIQNVWSKKPLPLVVRDADGTTRTIKAHFDPEYSGEEGARSDARKLMGGNRHGSAAEQRVTLDLADDYYEIAEGATYNYSKAETGKDSVTHQGVRQWHYFVNDILFQEYGESKTAPYRVTINVKERSDGSYVYSFNAERQNERSSTRRTLHADVTGSAESETGNAQPSANSIRSSAGNSQEKFSVREAGITDREVLANALESTTRNAEERRILKWYREVAKSLTEHEQLLEDARQKLADHKSGEKVLPKGKAKNLENYMEYIVNKLDEEDRKLLKIESMGPMRKLLERERAYVERRLAGAQEEKNRYQAEFEQRLQEARRHEQESLLQYRQRREESEQRRALKAQIERSAKQLADRLNTNTDKKHIPEPLKKPVAQLLTALDFSSQRVIRGGELTRGDREYLQAMKGIRDVLAEQESYQNGLENSEDVLGGYLDLPPGMIDLMDEHMKKVENIIEKHMPGEHVLRRMDTTELMRTQTILAVVSRSVTKMNQLLENRTYAQVADAAEDSIAALHQRGQYQGTAEKAEQFVTWDNTLPWYAFQRFGKGGAAIFEELMDGQDKLGFNMKKVLDFRKALIDDETARAWDTETHQVDLLDDEGKTVKATLTTAQLMGLYCLSRRKQAMGHLMGGGIRIANIEGQGKLGRKTIRQDDHFKLNPELLGQALGLLTDQQIAAADRMQRFMTDQGAEWGNEVTMKRFGYRGFTEEIYYPIETDRQDRITQAGDGTEGSLYRLQNISAVKPVVRDANNALVVRGIFDVFTNHMADMAKYNAMVIPIVDAQKWYNYKSDTKNEQDQVITRTVQRAMTKAYGQSANRYVVQLLKDLNGVKESGARGEQFAVKMISNYKRAAVAANLRVAVLQPTAYVRAAAVLDYKYLAAAFAEKTSTRQAIDEMLKNSGIALWKDMGFFDTDVGRSVRDQIKGKGSRLEKLVDKSMTAAEWGDKLTWARLWRACKLEVQEKQKLSGQALLEGTARRFREVVYQTQVVDSTMTRSDIMRSSSTFSKIATSFMSEPTVSYNLVMEGVRRIAEDAKRTDLKTAIGRNWKITGRAFQAYVVSALASAVVESLADALRDTDDDPLWEKLLDAFGGWDGNLVSDLNPLNKLPYLREVFNALDGQDNGRMDTEVWDAFKKTYDILMETYRLATGKQEKATDVTYYGNMTTYGKVYQTFRAVSMLSGLPISAASRELVTAWNNTAGLVWPGLKCRTYESKKLREAYKEYAKPAGIDYEVLTRAMEYVSALESDKDEEGKAVSGSLKAKYVAYIQSLGLTPAQEKAMWLALKNSAWSDKGTPWA